MRVGKFPNGLLCDVVTTLQTDLLLLICLCGPFSTHFALMLIDLCAFSKTCYCRSKFQLSAVKPRDLTMCAAP